MKPEQFISEQGLGKAKKVLGQSPALKCYYLPKYEQYFTDKHGFIYVLGMFGYFTPSLGMVMDDLTNDGFLISDLKHLVESLEILEKSGGYEAVKAAVSNYRNSGDMVTFSSLEKRLKDHESIYGGGDE
ncbi:hypothetical protein ABTU74_16670 [Acinetobacter baumannii]|nr:hypothetical protein [Acinetobacter baumannii]